jgi:hypothetical protein
MGNGLSFNLKSQQRYGDFAGKTDIYIRAWGAIALGIFTHIVIVIPFNSIIDW